MYICFRSVLSKPLEMKFMIYIYPLRTIRDDIYGLHLSSRNKWRWYVCSKYVLSKQLEMTFMVQIFASICFVCFWFYLPIHKEVSICFYSSLNYRLSRRSKLSIVVSMLICNARCSLVLSSMSAGFFCPATSFLQTYDGISYKWTWARAGYRNYLGHFVLWSGR